MGWGVWERSREAVDQIIEYQHHKNSFDRASSVRFASTTLGGRKALEAGSITAD
jgi:hypothetical protein